MVKAPHLTLCLFFGALFLNFGFSGKMAAYSDNVKSPSNGESINVCILPFHDNSDASRIGDFKYKSFTILLDLIDNEYPEYELVKSYYNLGNVSSSSRTETEFAKKFWRDEQPDLEMAKAYMKDAGADVAITLRINSTSFSDKIACYVYDGLNEKLYKQTHIEGLENSRTVSIYHRINVAVRLLLDDCLERHPVRKSITADATPHQNFDYRAEPQADAKARMIVFPIFQSPLMETAYNKADERRILTDISELAAKISDLELYIFHDTYGPKTRYQKIDGKSELVRQKDYWQFKGFFSSSKPNLIAMKEMMRSNKANYGMAFHIRAGRDAINVSAFLINSNQDTVEVLKGTSPNYPHGFVGYEKIREIAEKIIRRFVLADLLNQSKQRLYDSQIKKGV